jgi:hypothetical protein
VTAERAVTIVVPMPTSVPPAPGFPVDALPAAGDTTGSATTRDRVGPVKAAVLTELGRPPRFAISAIRGLTEIRWWSRWQPRG